MLLQILQILDYTHFFISLNTIDDWIDTPRCHNDSALQYSGQRCTVYSIDLLLGQRQSLTWGCAWAGFDWEPSLTAEKIVVVVTWTMLSNLKFSRILKKTQYFWCELLYCRSFIGQLVELSFERYLSLANMWRIFFLQIFRATLFPCCVFSYSLCLCFSRLCGWRLNKWKFIFTLTRPKTVNILP